MKTGRQRLLWSVPWVLALIGLAVPMIGSGFIGWPFVVGWLVLLLLIWWSQPFAGTERAIRLAIGIAVVIGLFLLATLGGLYLLPAVVAWMLLVGTDHARDARSAPSLRQQPPHS